MQYIPIHVHSVYSVWDSLLELGEYLEFAKLNQLPALSLTDHGNVCGLLEFANLCKDSKIKPILGCEFYVNDKPDARDNYHLVVIAKSYKGYRNIVALNNRGAKENFYYKIRLKNDWLLNSKVEDIIITTACIGSEIGSLVLSNHIVEANEMVKKYHKVYGDDFYLELQFNEMQAQHIVNEFYLDCSQKFGIRTVIGIDSHYNKPEDHEIRSVLHGIMKLAAKAKKEKPEGDKAECKNLSLKTITDLYVEAQKYKFKINGQQFKSAIESSNEIADKCNVEFDKKLKYPRVRVADIDKAFLNGCKAGLQDKYRKGVLDTAKHQHYIDRIKLEYEALQREGYLPLFVISSDFIQRAKAKGIPVGPGRGSVIGSFCSFLLGITCIDPIRHNLFFERFCPLTSGGRVTSPDIDIDFTDRDAVISILKELYGNEHVLSVSNFAYYKPKSTIVDLLRLKGIDTNIVFGVSKKFNDKLSLDENLKLPQLQDDIEEYKEEFALLHKLSERVEPDGKHVGGKIRHIGKHASAVIVLPENEELPVFKKDSEFCTQNNGKILEKYGFLKLDVLNIDTLSIIDNTIKAAGINLDIYNMNLEDPEVLKEFQGGYTVGVFQCEEPHTINVLRNIKIKSFEDIVNTISIIRPGLDKGAFIKNCNQPQHIVYDRGMRSILEPTFGVLLFQEQVMAICRDIAGFSLSEADEVRRSIAKKTKDMQDRHLKFISGAIVNGYENDLAEKIWGKIAACEDYIFNKSHACGYAYLSYLCMYLKHYHPKEFLMSCLKFEKKLELGIKFFNEARRLGITVELPIINKSEAETSLKDGVIYTGLSAIKGVDKAAAGILKHGPYRSLKDFIARNEVKDTAKDIVDTMARIGVFREFESNRKFVELELRRSVNLRKKKKLDSDQMLLFKDKEITAVDDYSEDEKRMFEMEFVGYSPILTDIDRCEDILTSKGIKRLDVDFEGSGVVCGQIIDIRYKKTKKNKDFAIVTIEDRGIRVGFMIWEEDLNNYQTSLGISEYIICKIVRQEGWQTSTLVAGDTMTKIIGLKKFLGIMVKN